jgi:diacylglycerol kinase (ATP)
VVTAFVLVAEIFSSAIEALCDFVDTRHNEKIKVIEDIAAAVVGIAIFVWTVVPGVELGRFVIAAVAWAPPAIGPAWCRSSAGRPA